MKYSEKDLPHLRRRLANAKRRAVYWSNNPFTGRKTMRRGETSCRRAERYEITMCDIDSLCGLIESITGKIEPRFDPFSDFQRGMTKALNALNQIKKPAASQTAGASA